MLEFDARTVSPEVFRKAIISHGSVILRNAVPDSLIIPLGDAVEAMMKHYDAIPAEIIRREMEFDEAARQNVWREILNDGVHYNADLVTFSQGRHSLFDPLRRTRLQTLLEEGWPEKLVRENFVTNVRRIYSRDSSGYADTPLEPHIDAMFHQHDNLGINFWTPLTDAGIDQPGLAVMPMGVEETQAFVEYNPDGYERASHDHANMHLFRYQKLEPQALRDAGLADRFIRPKMRRGDILAFTNYTIHATSMEPHMTKCRTSIEVRVLLYERS